MTSAYGAEYAKGPATFQAISKGGSAAVSRRRLSVRAARYPQRRRLLPEDQGCTEAGRPLVLSRRKYRGAGDMPRNRVQPESGQTVLFSPAMNHMNQPPAGTLHSYFVPTPQMLSGNFRLSSGDPRLFFNAACGAWPPPYPTRAGPDTALGGNRFGRGAWA